MITDVVLVDVIKEVCSLMRVANISTLTESNINFEPGRSSQIITNLLELDGSVNYKDKKYPLIAMLMPIREDAGSGPHTSVRIERLVIATLTNSTDKILKRYEDGGTFKSILYPCYKEFLRRLALSPYINTGDPNAFVHTKLDNPGTQPIGNTSADYIDAIEILNLEFDLLKIKTC